MCKASKEEYLRRRPEVGNTKQVKFLTRQGKVRKLIKSVCKSSLHCVVEQHGQLEEERSGGVEATLGPRRQVLN